MKKHAAAWIRRLRDRRGESIGEVLVALLIAAVALMMLASLIATSTRLTRSSEERMQEYYTANENLTASLAAARAGTQSGSLVFTYLDGDNNQQTIPYNNIYYAENSEASGAKNKVVAFWKQSP